MSKKIVSLIVALVLILSLSATAFADTTPTVDNTTADIPVSIRQEFIDDAPAGQTLTSLSYEALEDGFFKVEGTYQTPAQARTTVVYGTKTIKLYYSSLYPVHIMMYTIGGEFSVPYDGTAATCTSAAVWDGVVTYDNPTGYQFAYSYQTSQYFGNQGKVTVYFEVYWHGEYKNISSDYGVIACDEYGNVY